jgi:hypothetical protein
MGMFEVTLPLRCPNPLNGSHGHWSKKAKMRKEHRWAAGTVCRPRLRYLSGDLTVAITRIAPSRGLDPHDGLGASLKGVIDGIADALGCDDRHPRVTWELRQERGPWGVRIEVRPRAA